MKKINLARYMGAWNVIANIPTFYEKNAYSPVESYRLQKDGTILNHYDSNRGSFGGKRDRIRAKAWVVDPESNAKWKVQFFWPIRFSYEILEVGADYEYAVVGHPSKRYVWIMARKLTMEPLLLEEIKERLAEMGYPVAKIRMAPQRPALKKSRKVA